MGSLSSIYIGGFSTTLIIVDNLNATSVSNIPIFFHALAKLGRIEIIGANFVINSNVEFKAADSLLCDSAISLGQNSDIVNFISDCDCDGSGVFSVTKNIISTNTVNIFASGVFLNSTLASIKGNISISTCSELSFKQYIGGASVYGISNIALSYISSQILIINSMR